MESHIFTDIPGGLEALGMIRRLDPENFYDYLDPSQLPCICDCIAGDIVASCSGDRIGILSRDLAGSLCVVKFMVRQGQDNIYRYSPDYVDTFDRMATPQEVKILRRIKEIIDQQQDG